MDSGLHYSIPSLSTVLIPLIVECFSGHLCGLFQDFQSRVCLSEQGSVMLWWDDMFSVLVILDHMRSEFIGLIEPSRAAWRWTLEWRVASVEVVSFHGRYEHNHNRILKVTVLTPFVFCVLVRAEGTTEDLVRQHNPRLERG